MRTLLQRLVAAAVCLGLVALHSARAAEIEAGEVFDVQGGKAKVVRAKILPLVENEYSKRFRFDSADNPKLKELRERYELDRLVAAGEDEFARQVLLMDWVHHRFRRFGQPSTPAQGALEILKGIEEGQAFFCTQYAQLFCSAAASLGWVDRVLALRRHQGVAADRSSEHSTTEIWSNQHRKWVMLDPTSNMYLQKGGMPLNAWEIRQEWFYNRGAELVFVVGKEQARFRKQDLPIKLMHFAGFGDLAIAPDELDKYGFIGYIPNTDLMDAGFDYAQMFITRDALCDGTAWHKRKLPENPAVDPYFPIGQAALSLAPVSGELTVSCRTLTPNLKEFQVRTREQWEPAGETIRWKLEAGLNRLEVRTMNRFGVTGPVSAVEIEFSR